MYEALFRQTWPIQLGAIFAIFLARAAIFAGGGTLWIRLSKWADRHRIVLQDTECRTLLTDIFDGVQILGIDALATVAVFQLGWLRVVTDGSLTLVFTTFVAMFVWMEIYFYYSHRLLHHPKLFWIHRRHHDRRATNPWTSLSFSLAERIALLVGAILVPSLLSQWLPISVEGFFGYFLFNYIFNVYGHLNVETVPNGFLKTGPGRFFFTTTFHALHHARYRGHYGLFTQFLDRWHGTQFADYESFHRQVFDRANAAASNTSDNTRSKLTGSLDISVKEV